MKKAISIIILLVVIVSLIFVFYDGTSNSKETEESFDGYGVNSGQEMYDYELEEIGSSKSTSIDKFEGKPTIVIFWASWCPYCKQTLTELNTIEDINVVAINVPDSETSKTAAEEFLEENNFKFKGYIAEDVMYSHFPIQSFPTTVFVNSDGFIFQGTIGGLTKEIILNQLENMY